MPVNELLPKLIGKTFTVRTRSGKQWTGQLQPTDAAGILAIDVPASGFEGKPYRAYVVVEAIEAIW